MELELAGIEVHGFHGVLERERQEGQRFLVDVWLEVDPPPEDRIEDAVDYREVAAAVERVSGTPRRLLETLAGAIADELKEAFPVRRVRVRVRKPDVGLPVDHVAATAER